MSIRPAPEKKEEAAPASTSGDEGDMVGEDEIIETEEEVRSSEGQIALGGKKGSGPPNRKAQH